MNRMADGFEADVGEILRAVVSSASEMEATRTGMSGTPCTPCQRSSAVAAAAEEADAGMQTVASAAEELASSIGEITRQVAHAAGIGERAVQDAQRTDTIVRALAEGAQKIGDVVDADHRHRQPDQPARAQRHDRGRTGRRRRQRLRGRRLRSERARQSDRQGDPGHRRADHRDPVRDRPGGRRDPRHHSHHRARSARSRPRSPQRWSSRVPPPQRSHATCSRPRPARKK